jgi:hypothetical protein
MFNTQEKVMAEPMCPECKAKGTSHITFCDSDAKYINQGDEGDGWFQIVYCDVCGHVYGVFAKVVAETY